MKILKRIMTVFTPLAIVGFLLFFLADFKHLKKLDAEERACIERYQKEHAHGGHLRVKAIFSEEDYNAFSTSLSRLLDGANYKVLGQESGVTLGDPKGEFKKLRDLLLKRESPQKQKEFLGALQVDLTQAEKHYGSRLSRNLLSDLSHYVFPKNNQKIAQQYGSPKTLHVMQKTGIRIS